MKIYPSTSKVTVTKEVNILTDIPLSYIDTNAIDYTLNTLINEKFKTKEKKEILPYDKVDSTVITLFDKYNNQIPYEEIVQNLVRDGDKYMYIPKGSKRFKPKTFEYNVTIKKHQKYASNMPYNINAIAYNNKNLANNLMPIFGDAPSRLAAPANISVNNGDLSLSSLTSMSIKKADVTFLMLKNHLTSIEDDFMNPGQTTNMPFDKMDFIDNFNSNLFCFYSSDFAVAEPEDEEDIEQEKVLLYSAKEEIDYEIDEPIVFSKVNFSSKKYFNIPRDKDNIMYHSLFNIDGKTPILIEEHEGKSFMVYAVDELIKDPILYSKVIYETLSYIYFNRYLESDLTTEWIADEVPDYIIKNKTLIKKNKFTSNIEVNKLFGLSTAELEIIKVNIDKDKYPYVKYTGINENYLIFEKVQGENNEYADPIKKDNDWISIYTQPEIFFYKDFLYRINDSIEDCIKIQKIDDYIRIDLKPFRHSDAGIYVKEISTLNIPLTKIVGNKEEQIQNADFYLVCKSNESASYFEIKNSTEYTKSDGYILLTIQVRQNGNQTIMYDMRNRGGGLPEGEKDNFDCLDIGHLFGRPYRKAGTLIITLPIRLKPHEETIKKILNQYCAAEDYPILLFKEDK